MPLPVRSVARRLQRVQWTHAHRPLLSTWVQTIVASDLSIGNSRKVARQPAGIWIEGGCIHAPELLVIIHIQPTEYPPVGSCASVFTKGISRGV